MRESQIVQVKEAGFRRSELYYSVNMNSRKGKIIGRQNGLVVWGTGCGRRGWSERSSLRELCGVMKLFYVLILVVVTWLCIYLTQTKLYTKKWILLSINLKVTKSIHKNSRNIEIKRKKKQQITRSPVSQNKGGIWLSYFQVYLSAHRFF